MLSGIGPQRDLKSHNISVVLDQSWVGLGMADNPMNAIYVPSPADVEISLIQVVGSLILAVTLRLPAEQILQAIPVLEALECSLRRKLHLYPNGDKESNGEGHISMYLTVENTDAMPPGWEIHAEYKFFVLDQIRDKYLVLQDAVKRERRFRAAKKEWGLARILSRDDFEDVDKGFLVKDKCVFGVEIFVHNYCGKGECLAKPENLPLDSTYSWKVTNYSTLTNAKCTSPLFTLGNYKWYIDLYPRGFDCQEGKCLSAFLSLDGVSTMARVYAEYKLSIKNQKHSKHKVNQLAHVFSPNTNWGWKAFLSLNDIQDDSKGFLVSDTLIIEAEITSISTVKSLS